MPEPVLYINGMPGVGKHTVAKAVQKHLGMASTIVSESGQLYIVTDDRISDDHGTAIANEHRDAARRANRLFVPVILECATEEHEKRLTSDERREKKARGANIEVDPHQFMVFRGLIGEIHRFRSPEELVIDVTEMTAEQTAAMISDHVKRVMREERERVEEGLRKKAAKIQVMEYTAREMLREVERYKRESAIEP
ncbi:MAG: hypothetical protein Q9199_004280 [Rusavskia elegans]